MPSVPNTPGVPLRSDLVGDPDMAELVDLFVAELPQRVRAASEAWSEHRLDDLRRVAHQLRGASASYGFPAIGDAAGRVEDSIRDLHAKSMTADLGKVRAGIDELTELCRRAAK